VGALRVTVTGATGLIGPPLVAALRERGAEVTVLSRDPQRARATLQRVQAERWEPLREPAPAQVLEGRQAVVHLAGAPVAQRWSRRARRAIRDSRVLGTRNLIEGLRHARARPATLISSSAIGYYGLHGEEPLDEDSPPGAGFLARVCAAWEQEAQAAQELGMRVLLLRTGVVLDPAGGALAKMLPPFKLGIGGPVAGGRQYVSWIHREDLIGMIEQALADERWRGPVNATAPRPVTNRELSRALAAVLNRPAVLPVPALALLLLYGEMAEVVTGGARVLPAKALVLGYRFRQPELTPALRSALGSPSR
jgi:uncharacterized protein (TIGR01777 family)